MPVKKESLNFYLLSVLLTLFNSKAYIYLNYSMFIFLFTYIDVYIYIFNWSIDLFSLVSQMNYN